MSTFYTSIAKYYDYIFPTGKAQIDFIQEVIGQGPKNILDVACGSGGYAKHFSDLGHQVVAIDLDEQMIKGLKTKVPELESHVMNMHDIDSLNQHFDVIYCIGNSLVHLDHLQEIKQFLMKCYEQLNEGGTLVLQIVNYDRILDQKVKELPMIKNETLGLTFERFYHYFEKQHKIDFKTILTVDEQRLENHQVLFPLRSDELRKSLKQSGFSKLTMYGSFKKDPYIPHESFACIVIANK